jgi:glycerol-3-phosphate dehydrogenase (NAD(P)+)
LILHRKGCRVIIWGPFPEYVERVRREHTNPLYLPGIPLPAQLTWTSDRAEAMDKADLVILAVPSKYFQGVLETFAGLLPAACPVISVSKGLDTATHRRLTEVAVETLKPDSIAVLSGPSHAEEVARGVPTAVVLACANAETAKRIQAVLMSPLFRIYTSDDVIGVELGGALKNVIALAIGASDGIGFGDNTRAALITRGLAEISRLGCALGARPETFAGLSGMGDLIVTCTSHWSRNRAVGERLGRGESLDQIVKSMQQVAEGVTTCGIARALARKLGIRTPITEEVYALIHDGKSPQQAVQALLGRTARPERD